jgi:hypothetical protein
MTEEFNNKLADALWTLLEPRIQSLIESNTEIDAQISDYMSNSFRLDDYSYDLDGMIDTQVQHLAENGDLKEWLGNREDTDDEFRRRVYSALNDYYDIRLVRKIDG